MSVVVTMTTMYMLMQKFKARNMSFINCIDIETGSNSSMNTSKIAIQKARLSLFNLSNHHAPEEESKKQKPKPNIVRSFSGQVCSFFKFIHKNLS
uniref:Uncharacterized protein n=1 Tax=Acrobeloides nanus TaxID=290746 RepID=A0A914DNU6_9BILA